MKTPSSLSRVIITLTIAIAALMGLAAWLIHYLAVDVPVDLAKETKEQSFDAVRRVENGFKNVFNFTPKIVVNGTTVVEQSSPVMELATVQQGVAEHYQWSQTWFGSTKTMELEGSYMAKAGFDLRKPFRVTVEGNRATVMLPKPELLSLEMKSYKVMTDNDGWWNKINSGDRESAITAMQEQARTKAVETGILEQAKEKFQKQIDDAVKSGAIPMPVDVVYEGDVPPASTPSVAPEK